MPRKAKKPAGYGTGNRTDRAMAPASTSRPSAQPIRTPTGLPYGQAGALKDAQRAVPLPQEPGAPTPPPAAVDPHRRLIDAATAFTPRVGLLNDPDDRPDEPVTAGLDVGAGPGSEVLPMSMSGDPVMDELRAIYRRYPNEDLRELIQDLA